MNKVKSWVNTHKKQTILIVVAIILILTTITATAMLNQPKPVSNDTSTTTSVKENTSKPQTEDIPKTDSKPDDTTTNPESKTESSTVESETKPTESTSSHDTSEPVWVENWVTEEIEPGYTEYIATSDDCVFSDGTTFNSATDGWDAIYAYQKKLTLMGVDSAFTNIPHYELIEYPAVTRQIDKGYYETRVVGREWVVDIPGHWA